MSARWPAWLIGPIAAAALASTAVAQTAPSGATFFGGSLAPAGTTGQTQYNNGGVLGAYSLTGDCSFAVTTGILVCGNPYLEKQTFFTSTTGSAALNVPQGVTPSAPANGDMWATSSGLFVQIAGSTVGPLAAAGAGSGCPTATPCTTQQTINDATANRYGLVFGPATLASGTTGHGINIVDTVNDASAVDGVVWFSNTTCTACTATTYLIDMQVASATQFRVSTVGALSVPSGVTAGGTIQAGATSQYTWTGRGILTSKATGSVQLGGTDAATAVAQTLSAQSIIAGTSNVAGADTVIQGSLGTGTGAGGQLIFKTASAGTTGSAQNASSQAGVFDTTQFFIPGGGTPTCGTGCASIAAGATNQRMLVTTGTAVTTIAVNFSKTLTTAPICTASEIAGTPLAIGFSAAPTTSGFTLTAASALTATVIAVTCL